MARKPSRRGAKPAPAEPAEPAFSVLREKHRILHSDSSNRSMEVEVVLRNEGPDERTYYTLLVPEFLLGLTVRDWNDKRLAYLPRWKIEELVGDVNDFIQELAGQQEMQEPDENTRLLWINFREKVPPGGEIGIILSYQDNRAPAEGLGFVRSPRFDVDEDKRVERHDTFFEIMAPPEGRIKITRREGMPDPPAVDDHTAGVWEKQKPRFLQVRIPRGHEPIQFEYRIKPLWTEAAFIWSSFLVLTLLPGLLLGLAAGGRIELNLEGNSPGELVAPLGIGATIAMARAFAASWTNRLWYGFPLALYLWLLIETLL